MSSTKCNHCNYEIQYKGSANFIIFCPNCMKYTFLECEYGYGPVTPCYIYLGNEQIGIITSDKCKYYLQTKYSNKIIELENTYLNALQEATSIIEEKIKIN